MASIDMTKSMRQVVTDDPLFGEFLVDKGFPFSVENPITELVTFADVVQMRHLDKDAFLAEYDYYREHDGTLPEGASTSGPGGLPL